MSDTIYANNKEGVVLLCGYILLAYFDGLISIGNASLQRYYSLLVLAFFLFNIAKNHWKIRLESTYMPWIYLIGLGWFSCCWSINLSATLYRNQAYTLCALMLVIFSSCYHFEKKEIRVINNAIILGAILLLLWLVFNFDSTVNMFRGRLLLAEDVDANGFAIRLLLPFYVSLQKMTESNRLYKRAFYLVLSIIFVYVGLMTGSRGFLVSVAVSMLVYTLQKSDSGLVRKIVVPLLIMISLYFIASEFLPENILDRLFTSKSYGSEGSSLTRQTIWAACLQTLHGWRTIIGYGSGCDLYVTKSILGFNIQAHNTYITMLLEYGILGVPVFIVSLFRMLRSLLKRKEVFAFCELLAMLIGVFFLSAYAKRYLWVALIYASIVSNYYKEDEEYGLDIHQYT